MDAVSYAKASSAYKLATLVNNELVNKANVEGSSILVPVGTTATRPDLGAGESAIRYNSDLGGLEEWTGTEWKNLSVSIINKPVITSPVNLTVGYIGAVTSTYSAGPFYGGLQTGAIWECALDANFNIIKDSYEGSDNLTSWTPNIGLALTQVYIRTKQISDGHRSDFSDVISFTTPDIYVQAPTISISGNLSELVLTPTISLSAFTVYNGSDIHVSTDYQVVNKATGIVKWESLGNTVDKFEITTSQLDIHTEYTFRARFNGQVYGSSSWVELDGTTINIYVKNPVLTVQGTPNSITLTPTISGTPFSVFNSTDAHISTDYRVVKVSDDTVAFESLNNTVNLTSIQVTGLNKITKYKFMIRYNSSVYGSSNWVEVTGTTLDIYVKNPTLTVSGAPNNITLTPTLTGSTFSVYNSTDTHVSTDYRVVKVSDNSVAFESLVDTVNLTSIQATGLKIATAYKFMIRYNGALYGSSDWIEVVNTTANTYINTPTLTVEGTPNNVPEKPVLTGSAFSVFNGSSTHVSTDWVIEDDGVVVWSSLGNTTNKLTITVPAGILVESNLYTFKVKYNSGTYGSSAYNTITGTTKSDFLSIGDFFEGGYYAGNITRADGIYALIVSPRATGQAPTTLAWKNVQSASGGCKSLNDGAANTAYMVSDGNATKYPAAHFCNNLVINGFTDWYLPARDELEIAYRNLKPTTESNSLSARTKSSSVYTLNNDVSGDTHGINRHSVPTGAAYTTANPAQTSLAPFKQGGAESFATGQVTYNKYWSSTEYNSNGSWKQNFSGANAGYQEEIDMIDTISVRAFRAIKIS